MTRTSKFCAAALEYAGGLCVFVAIFATIRDDSRMALLCLAGSFLFTLGKWFVPEKL